MTNIEKVYKAAFNSFQREIPLENTNKQNFAAFLADVEAVVKAGVEKPKMFFYDLSPYRLEIGLHRDKVVLGVITKKDCRIVAETIGMWSSRCDCVKIRARVEPKGEG